VLLGIVTDLDGLFGPTGSQTWTVCSEPPAQTGSRVARSRARAVTGQIDPVLTATLDATTLDVAAPCTGLTLTLLNEVLEASQVTFDTTAHESELVTDVLYEAFGFIVHLKRHACDVVRDAVEGDDTGLIGAIGRRPCNSFIRVLLGDGRLELPFHSGDLDVPHQMGVIKLSNAAHTLHEVGELFELGPLVVNRPNRAGHIDRVGVVAHGLLLTHGGTTGISLGGVDCMVLLPEGVHGKRVCPPRARVARRRRPVGFTPPREKDPAVSQNDPTAPDKVDVVTLILADHREVDRIFEALREDVEGRAVTVRQLRALLLAHSEAEEAVVYTALKPEMSDEESDETDGDVIDEAFDEHAEMEQLIEELAATSPTSEEFESILLDVIDSVNHHVEEEEEELLPKLRQICTPEQMQQITQEFHKIRMRVLEDEGGEDLGLAPAVMDPLMGVERTIDVRQSESEGADR
jgi:hypothetical protein